MLIIFQLASGLQVNFHKSSLIGINTSKLWIEQAAAALHCKIGDIPFTYLGLPIGGNASRIQLWEPIISKISQRLASWKGRMLSIGGRITLIKSSLTSLPLYYMSIYPIPKGVVNKINMISRSFLWNTNPEKKSLSLVSWSQVQLPKILGGLGIGNLTHKNLSLLFKWVWRFFESPQQLLCQVIRAKHKYPSNLCITDLSIPTTGGIWKQICSSIFQHPHARDLALKGIRRNVGDGTKCLFWHDSWVEATALKNLFPRLYKPSIMAYASVDSLGFWEGFNWVWTFSWKRALRPQDAAEKSQLDKKLKDVCLACDGRDKLVWTFSGSGQFSTKSFSLELDKVNPIPHRDAIK